MGGGGGGGGVVSGSSRVVSNRIGMFLLVNTSFFPGRKKPQRYTNIPRFMPVVIRHPSHVTL